MLLFWRHSCAAANVNIGFSLGEMDLEEWRQRRGLKWGDDMTAFFKGED
jgi:hypothetical protein